MQGTVFPAEWSERRDSVTGLVVRQLTDYKGHSHHLYFTNPGWYDGGRKLLFGSDRNNETHLFCLDLVDGWVMQLTERPQPDDGSFLNASLNPLRAEVYYWQGRDLIALDLHSLEERTLCQAPDGFRAGITNCTADGRFVCTGLVEDLSGRFPVDLLHGYVGFAEYWEARPLSRILKVATDGSGAEVVWEENSWIGHVNTSPKVAHLLTFCHEGPWDRVDQRIWGLDLNSGNVWKIRPTNEGDRVGHEYWLADGETIGYHGRIEGQPVFGFVRYDDSERREAVIHADSTHFHSNHRNLIVGDGTARQPHVLLWRWQGKEIEGPRILCRHRCSFHIQQTHVHPRFSPDDRSIVFTSDPSGYGNLYMIEVPDFEALPPLKT